MMLFCTCVLRSLLLAATKPLTLRPKSAHIKQMNKRKVCTFHVETYLAKVILIVRAFVTVEMPTFGYFRFSLGSILQRVLKAYFTLYIQ